MKPNNKIQPLDLKRTAAAIASNHGDKGAIVITMGEEGIRVGVHGLSDKEIQDALCVVIHYNFCFMGKDS